MKTDARPGRFRGSLWTMAGLVASRGFVVVLGFLSSVVWTRAFDRDTYGSYQEVLAAGAVIASFCLPGLNDATLISAAKHRDGNLGVIIRQRALIAAIGAAALAVFGAVRYGHADPRLALTFAMSALVFVPIQLQPIWQSFTNGKSRFRALTVGQMVLAASSTIAIAMFPVLHATSPAMLPWALLASQGAYAVVCLYLHATLRSMKENDERDPSIVRYGHHVTIASLLGWVFSSDRLIVGEILTKSDVALLSVAIILPAQVKVFFSAFEQVFLPKVTAVDSLHEAWRYIRPRMTPLAAGYTFLGFAGFIALPIVIPLFFSHRYVDAVPYAKWLWLSTCLTSPIVFLSSILNSQRDHKFLYLRNLLSPAFTLALFGLLIPHYGLVGAVIARIANHIMLALLYLVYFWRALREPRPA